MPKVSEHKEDRIRRIIRDTLAIDPIISILGLQGVLEKKLNQPIARQYVTKLVKKVNGETRVNIDREKAEIRVAQMRENNRLIREQLLKIAYPTQEMHVEHKDQLKALELIAKIDATQARLEMDFGIFTRQLGELDVNHRFNVIPDEVRLNIIKTFGMWSVSPPVPRKIEVVEVVTPKLALPTDGEQNTKPSATKQERKPVAIPTVGESMVVPG